MDDPSTTLAELRASLEGLEAACEPLFSKPYRETLAGLDNVEKAKMDVLLAFAINNLVWGRLLCRRACTDGAVYLRSRGIDPETHDVTRELERVKTYYGKVRAAEGSPAGEYASFLVPSSCLPPYPLRVSADNQNAHVSTLAPRRG